MINTPQFTLIPSNYANNPDSGFSIIRNGKKASKKPIIKEDFFLLWLPVNKSEDSLNLAIKRHYPQIPVDKAFTCSIKLAYPKDLNNKKKTNQRPSIIKEVTIGKILPISLSTKILVEIPLIKVPNERNLIFGDRSISGSAYFWSLALKLALQLISEGNIIPKIEKVEQSIEDLSLDTSKAGSLIGSWKPILRSQIDFKNYGNILYLAPLSAHNIPFNVKNVTQIIDPSELLTDYLNSITDILVRQSLKAGKYSSFQDVYGLSPTKIEKLGDKIPWEVRMLSGLIIKNSEFNIYRVSEEVIPDVITKWTQIVNHPYWKDGFNLTLKLKMPSSEVGSWILDYFIQSIRNEEIFIPLKDFWQLFEDKKKKTGKKKSNKNLIKHIDNKWKIRRNILASLNGLSSLFPAIEQSLLKKNPESVKVSVLEASDFLEYIGKQMKSDGFGVIIPDEFTNQGKQRLKTVMHIKSETPEMEKLKDVDGIPKYGEIIDTSFDINSILSYKWELQIGNESLSEDDFNKLLDKKTNEPLIFWNNKWILLERREVSAIRDTFKEQRGGNIKAEQALFLGLTGETYLEKKKKGKNGDNKKFGPYEVILEGPIQEIVDTLTGRKEPEKRQQPKNLNGKLRPYQKIGFNWLLTMTSMGFNICLADDMGLGKTIQVISYILEKLDQKQKFKPKNRINSLIICPTSVLGNWQREIDQFAPDLKVGFYYGSSRPSDLNGLTKLLKEKDILLTSYGLLRRDIKLISLVNWDIVVLDESQNIKNYKTKQTQASYELKATSKICLTGTPIENHLSELWSMFHFLNPFLLDKRSSFIKRYFIPIERLGNAAASEKLRKTIMPFLLRRLKSDKTIIKDLPEKQEIKLFIDLTERQKKTYAAVVEEGLEKIAMQEEVGKGSALKRKGAILNTIMKLKQVCNHPAQALHENIELKEENISKFISDSAKLKRIVEMLEEIKASGDKILIFTQFRVMGDYLEDIIRDIMNIEPLYLHGGVPQKKRDEMVLNFQNDESNIHPVFILSLKAGGTGLNLTKASTVLHFDRWWNPAVENQATDRAYRIGQKKNVMVYKMISTGTIEEKIDKMIEQKKELADKIIASSNEDWITDLNNDDLRELFRLDEGALGGQ